MPGPGSSPGQALVPGIPLRDARPCQTKRDCRVEPGHDKACACGCNWKTLAQPLQERDHLCILLRAGHVEQGCALCVARVPELRIFFEMRLDAVGAPGNHGDENVAL